LADSGLSDAARWLALAGGSPGLAMELAVSGQGGWLEVLVKKLSGSMDGPYGLAGELEKAVKDSKGKLHAQAVVDTLQKWLVDLTLGQKGLPVRYFLPQQAIISGLADMIPATR
jgi:DNA polymerase-3 subunit delta'